MNKAANDTRDQLLARRTELLERLESIKRDYAGGLDRDMEDQALQLENAEVLEVLSRQAVEELEAINRKLDRLAKST